MLRVALVGLLLGVVQLGCAGKTLEDGEGGAAAGGKASKPPPQTATAAAQCKSLASTWCNKAFGCYVQVGRLAESQRKANADQCIKLFVEHAPCSEVTSVGSEYGTCLAQIKAMSCSQWDVPQEQFGTIVEPVTCETALAFD